MNPYFKSDRKIKMLHVVPDLGIGGLSRVVVDICRNIDRSKFEVSVYSLRKCAEEFTSVLEEINISVFTPTFITNKPDYLNFYKLFKYLRRHNIDIIHTHNTAAFLDGVIAAKLAGTPIVIHTDHARLYPDKRRYILAERYLSKLVTKVVAVSEHTRLELIKYQKIATHKIVVIPNGINEWEYNIRSGKEKKEELGVGDRYPILGLGVRLSEQKGIRYLLDSMPLVVKEFPKTALLIVGGGPQLEVLQKRARMLGIDSFVKFLSFRFDMPEILSILDIYVLPSLWEGLPLVILEAMAAKKPIVATAVGGIPEAIVNGHSGLLVGPKDPSALANAILKVLKDEELRRTLAENAYRRYRRHYTVKSMVSKYEKLYLVSYSNHCGC